MKHFSSYLLASAAFLVPLSAFGQETATAGAGNEAYSDDVIIVTAQRREQSLSDVGLSITAIGGETLKERNFNNVEDLATLVPGLSVSDSGFATPIYTLRGVGINEPSAGSTSSVAVYVDEVPLSYPVITQGATFDLQRVEVLKGPQGTLYGQNATGGAINYIANKPTDHPSMGGSATLGRFMRGNVEGFISGPLSSTLKARLAARAQFGDDWQKSITRNDSIGRVENYTGRFILDWKPADTVRFALNLNGWLDKSDTMVPQLVRVVPNPNGLTDPTALAAPIPPDNARLTDWDPGIPFKRDDKFWQASLRGEVDVSDGVTLTSITAYAKFDRQQYSEYDGIASAVELRNLQYASIRSFSQELRLTASFHGATLIVGGNYVHDKTSEHILQFLPDSSQVQNIFGHKSTGGQVFADQKIESFAVFGNLDVPLTDQLSVSGGVRISEERRNFSGCGATLDDASGPAYTTLINFFRNLNGLAPIATLTANQCYSFYSTAAALAADVGGAQLLVPGRSTRTLREDNVPWNINVNFKPTPDSLIYARVSRGFKSGNFAALNTADNIAYKPIVQEELTAYELGARFSIGRVAHLEGAIFRYDYNNKQLRSRVNVGPPFGNVNAQDNIPRSRIKGAEFSVALRPVTGLELSGSGVYIDSEILQYIGYTVVGTTPQDLSGSPFNFTPKWSLNGNINYEMPISSSLNGFAGVNVAYRSSTSAVFSPPGTASLSEFDIPKYTLVDGQIGVKSADGKWKAFLWGKNIFDKYYITNVIRATDVIIRYPGMPATYGITASFKY